MLSPLQTAAQNPERGDLNAGGWMKCGALPAIAGRLALDVIGELACGRRMPTTGMLRCCAPCFVDAGKPARDVAGDAFEAEVVALVVIHFPD